MSNEDFINCLFKISEIEDEDFEGISLKFNRVWGHLQISDKMYPRYNNAINSFLNSNSYQEFNKYDKFVRGDIKGIFNRVFRRDQLDWMHVQIGLNLNRNDCGMYALKFGAFKSDDLHFNLILYNDLKNDTNLINSLNLLKKYIEINYNGIGKAIITKNKSISTFKSDKNSTVDYSDILSKIFEGSAEHYNTENILVNFLKDNGFHVEQNKLVDIFVRLKHGPAIFEIKSINDKNDKKQMRKAIAQLLEYNYIYNNLNCSLWILYSKLPQNSQYCIDFPKSLKINILWIEGNKIAGIDLDKLISSKLSD